MNIDGQPMLRKEINQRLTDILHSIGIEDSAELHAKLDEIFHYKPVDNYYVWVKGKLLFYEKRYEEAYAMVLGKEHWWFPGPYAPLLAQLQYEISAKRGTILAGREKILTYYTYVVAKNGINTNREIYANMEFVEEAKQTYLAAIDKKEELLKELQRGKLHDWEQQAYEKLQQLFQEYFDLFEITKALIVILARDKIGEKTGEKTERVTLDRFIQETVGTESNLGYYVRELTGGSKSKFILIAEEQNSKSEYMVLAKCLKLLQKECIILDRPIKVEADDQIDRCKTIGNTFENQTKEEGITVLKPIECYHGDTFLGTNVEYILDYLLKEEKNTYYNVLTSVHMFEQLRNSKLLEKRIRCLTYYKAATFSDEISFGYLGDYTSYISNIYGYPYLKQLEKEEECLFSIVIPARNSAYTLQHTLKTCMEQRNIGSEEYEIIISDNSQAGNLEVKKLVEAIGDSRIRYYKTPVELPLQRSFEFAYGMARGRYLFPIGSDDGILPWALETLKEMIIKYPKEPAIGWERGFFQWSKSKSVQRGKLMIPNAYQKGEYQDKQYSSLAMLKSQMISNAETIYSMPLFYLNTVFQRKWLLTLYRKTGVILDGYTQDVSMAIRSWILMNQMVCLKYPLTIAGLSDGSLGEQMVSIVSNNENLQQRIKGEAVRGFGNAIVETENPFLAVSSTEGMFWAELFQAKSLPICKEIITELIKDQDFQATVQAILFSQSISDIAYMSMLEKLRYNAYFISDDLGNWFDQVIYPAVTNKLLNADSLIQKESDFKQGYTPLGGLILDARKFGVDTIYDAVKLFENIVNL
ncbi:MAG: glycosyltransferase family A protein [Lachnospiraceae bacterium]